MHSLDILSAIFYGCDINRHIAYYLMCFTDFDMLLSGFQLYWQYCFNCVNLRYS